MRSRVYETVHKPSVCLSARPIILPSHASAAVLLLWPGGQEISIDCCPAGAQQQMRLSSVTSSADVRSTEAAFFSRDLRDGVTRI